MSEITLGAAKKNVESGVMLDAREAAGKLQREAAAARAEAAAAREALDDERAELDRQRHEFQLLEADYSRLKVQCNCLWPNYHCRSGGMNGSLKS